jgi:hypothetical protein
MLRRLLVWSHHQLLVLVVVEAVVGLSSFVALEWEVLSLELLGENRKRETSLLRRPITRLEY